MSKYRPLTDFLNASSAHHLPLTFAEVEAILGSKVAHLGLRAPGLVGK